MALCCPDVHSDLSCGKTGNKLAGLLFAHNSKLHRKLEREHLTSIQHLRSHHQEFIRVQGEEQRVLETNSQLHSMLDLIENLSPSPPLSPPPQQREEGNSVEILHNLLSTSEGKRVVSPAHQYLISRTSPELPRNREKVDYYVQKLGFPQEIVVATIESLGWEAHDNAILNRLNSRMKGSCIPPRPHGQQLGGEEAGGTAGISVVGGGGGGGGGGGEGVQRRVLDPSNLRPIVIDGSNVAMR